MPKKVVEQDLIPIERQIAAFPDGAGMAELEAALAVRGGPKIGRNDLCACGSGMKFKKCCGANGAPATLH